MASGVKVDDSVQAAFDAIKKKKEYRYLIFYIKDEKVIDIEKYGERNSTYDDYLKCLEDFGAECRYALYDFEYEHQCQGTTEKTTKQKLFLMTWCPDCAKVKHKMLYCSSFDALKAQLTGVGKIIQATDLSEASYESVLEKMRSTDRS